MMILNSRLTTQYAVLSMIAIAALCVAHIVANASPALAQSDQVRIDGRLVNATQDADAPEGLSVFVLLIDQEAEAIVAREETTTDAAGFFTISTPIAADGQFYRIVADDGIFTPYVDFPHDELPDEVVITIYERTTSLDQISLGKYAMVIPAVDVRNEEVGVLTSVTLINSGDRVYVADLEDPNLTGFNLLRFNLPEGYSQLSVESDLPSGNVMEIGTGFALSNPVPPGEYNILMSYGAPFENGELYYPMRLPFGAASVSILLPQGNNQLTGAGLSKIETVDINEKSYTSYQGTNYDRGSQLDVSITGLPTPSVAQQTVDFFGSSYFRTALVASVAVVLAASVGVVWLSANSRSRGDETTGPSRSAEISARSAIIRSIAELDEIHERGEIDDATYHSRRRELMQHAMASQDEETSSV